MSASRDWVSMTTSRRTSSNQWVSRISTSSQQTTWSRIWHICTLVLVTEICHCDQRATFFANLSQPRPQKKSKKLSTRVEGGASRSLQNIVRSLLPFWMMVFMPRADNGSWRKRPLIRCLPIRYEPNLEPESTYLTRNRSQNSQTLDVREPILPRQNMQTLSQSCIHKATCLRVGDWPSSFINILDPLAALERRDGGLDYPICSGGLIERMDWVGWSRRRYVPSTVFYSWMYTLTKRRSCLLVMRMWWDFGELSKLDYIRHWRSDLLVVLERLPGNAECKTLLDEPIVAHVPTLVQKTLSS